MKNNKTDRRSRYTKMIVRKSLLKLLQTKPLKAVSVSELCREAEVNRGTFYNHFYDVYDVYESIESEFFLEVQTRLRDIKTYDLNDDFFREMMLFISQNSDFMSMIAANMGESSLLKKVVEYARDKYVADFTERYPRLDKSVFDDVFTYTINGSIGTVVDWIKQGKQKSPEQMAALIAHFNRVIINGSLAALKD